MAAVDGAAGENINVAVVGIYELPKAAGAIRQGAAVYWDAGEKKVTTAAAGNAAIGAAITAADSAGLTVRVRLAGMVT